MTGLFATKMTTKATFLRGAQCRLGACDEVGEGNQERRVLSRESKIPRKIPDCQNRNEKLTVDSDPGFNMGIWIFEGSRDPSG